MILTPRDKPLPYERAAGTSSYRTTQEFAPRQNLGILEVDRRFSAGLRGGGPGGGGGGGGGSSAYAYAMPAAGGPVRERAGEDLDIGHTGKARIPGVSNIAPVAPGGRPTSAANRAVGKRIVQRPSSAQTYSDMYAAQAAGLLLGAGYAGRDHAEKRHAVPRPTPRDDLDASPRVTFLQWSHNKHSVTERDPIGQHAFAGIEETKIFSGPKNGHVPLRKQFHELQYVATADPMSCTLVHPPAERRPMRKPGAPAPDNMIATGGMQPVVDYSQGQKRLLKTVEHRTWQAAETAAVLQNRYQATDDAARVKLFDTRRERMEAEKRALINFHSQPDWRVSIFESNRRRQLDGSQSLNKGYLYEVRPGTAPAGPHA